MEPPRWKQPSGRSVHQHTRDPPPSGTLSLHLRSTRGQSLHMGPETHAHHRTGHWVLKLHRGPQFAQRVGWFPGQCPAQGRRAGQLTVPADSPGNSDKGIPNNREAWGTHSTRGQRVMLRKRSEVCVPFYSSQDIMALCKPVPCHLRWVCGVGLSVHMLIQAGAWGPEGLCMCPHHKWGP